MARLVVTRPIPEQGLAKLRERYEVVVHEDWLMNDDQLKEFVRGADVIVSLLTDHMTDEVMEAAGPQLKMIAQYTVGYDNIDLDAAKRRGIMVTNTAGAISGPAVAEHTFALMFACARHIIPADRYVRNGQYKHWEPNLFIGEILNNKTVGIVGTGQIGSIYAKMCHNGLGMRVLYTDVVANENLERDCGAMKVELDQLLAEADVVSIHVPLLPTTHHLINGEKLQRMKPSAILINTSRGPVVDEPALVDALRNHKIFAAGIDVYEDEANPAPGLVDLENVVVTPHIASATENTRISMAECVAQNVIAFSDGQTPPNAVKMP
jgi:lactate dehydrogenase-like 2-hydroxyacid dehydrogenase